MKRITQAACGLAAVAVALTGATGASAASAYPHMNYSGASLGGTDRSNVETMNDQISSIRTYGAYVKFWEDNGYSGRYFITNADWNDLRDTAKNLHWGETWNDQISSWDTSPYRTY